MRFHAERHGLQQTLDLRSKLREVPMRRRRFQVYDHVHRSQTAPPFEAAKNLPHPPFEAVPLDRIADLAAGRDPEPCLRPLVRPGMECRQGTVPLLTQSVTTEVVRTMTESLSAAQPFARRRGVPGVHGSRRLDAQTLAALAAAAREDCSALAGPHTDTEAMALLAPAIVGLKRTLHGIRPLSRFVGSG